MADFFPSWRSFLPERFVRDPSRTRQPCHTRTRRSKTKNVYKYHGISLFLGPGSPSSYKTISRREVLRPSAESRPVYTISHPPSLASSKLAIFARYSPSELRRASLHSSRSKGVILSPGTSCSRFPCKSAPRVSRFNVDGTVSLFSKGLRGLVTSRGRGRER